MTEFKRVFIDTSPIIYYLENNALYVDAIKRFFSKCLEENIQIVTSAVTVEEYLVFPYASGRMDLADCRRYCQRLRYVFTNDKQLRQERELPCMTVDDL